MSGYSTFASNNLHWIEYYSENQLPHFGRVVMDEILCMKILLNTVLYKNGLIISIKGLYEMIEFSTFKFEMLIERGVLIDIALA